MKIGNYTDDEILEFMTEGEGRGFLGRSMFDAMYFEIERLNNILDGYEKEMDNLIDARDKAIEYIEERYNGEVLTHTFDKDNVGELLEILDKGSDKE